MRRKSSCWNCREQECEADQGRGDPSNAYENAAGVIRFESVSNPDKLDK